MQRLGQSFNSAGIALFARVALVRPAMDVEIPPQFPL